MNRLVAIEANPKSLGEIFLHMPILSPHVATGPRLKGSLMSLATLVASAALLTSSSLVSRLYLLSRCTQLHWYPISQMNLPLLYHLDLQLDLFPPDIGLQLN